MTFDYDFVILFPFPLKKKREEEKENEVAKIVIKNYAFWLDLTFKRTKVTKQGRSETLTTLIPEHVNAIMLCIHSPQIILNVS